MISRSVFGTWLLAILSVPASVWAVGTASQLRILNRAGLDTDTQSLVKYLSESCLSPEQRQQQIQDIAAWIEQLAAPSFQSRQRASDALIALGHAAREHVLKATQSEDREVAQRAGEILKEIDSQSRAEIQSARTLAVLQLLKVRADPAAARVLLQTIERSEEPYLVNAGCEALWMSVDASHTDWLLDQTSNSNPQVRAASLIALGIVAGEKAVKHIEPYLSSNEEVLRLAAARAMIDQRPQEIAPILVELVSSEDDEIASQSIALLRMLSGQIEVQLGDQSWREYWKTWSENQLPTAQLIRLGTRRYDLSLARDMFIERFSSASENIRPGYGRFEYEADIRANDCVVDGMLRLEGNHPEGDQRLVITSRRLAGRQVLPSEIEVRALLKGENVQSGAWHLGLSVGEVKALFHPGYSGGCFRIETVHEHERLTNDWDLGFTPTGTEFDEMRLKVRRLDAKTRFEVVISQAAGQGVVFRRTFEFENEKVGSFDRIGLERSGREGGAALFDSIVIQLGGAALVDEVVAAGELGEPDDSGIVSGAENPPTPGRIAKLIDDLGSDVYLIREKADQQLQDLGEEARSALEEASHSPDLEIQYRSEALLRKLELGDDPESDVLSLLDPSKEGTLKSPPDGQRSTVTVYNMTDEHIHVFWLGYQGKRKNHRFVSAGDSHLENTHKGHAFIITNSDGEGLAIFRARATPSVVEWKGDVPTANDN